MYLSSQLFQNFNFLIVPGVIVSDEGGEVWRPVTEKLREEVVERNQGGKKPRPSSVGGENEVLGHSSETLTVSQG